MEGRGKGGGECHGTVYRFRSQTGGPVGETDDLALPGCASGFRPVFSAREFSYYGAAYERRTRAVRNSLAWPYAGRHYRYGDTGSDAGAVSYGEGSRVYSEYGG